MGGRLNGVCVRPLVPAACGGRTLAGIDEPPARHAAADSVMFLVATTYITTSKWWRVK